LNYSFSPQRYTFKVVTLAHSPACLMQGIRSMHCTFWAEGVREIISAEDSDVKFIINDHPVTIYNHALPPEAAVCAYPLDPSIALKASQMLFLRLVLPRKCRKLTYLLQDV
jgi:hypothetical protein